jgi:membrane fusion protein, copper/silver efflux system
MNSPETFEEKTPAEGPAIAETPQGPPRGVATMAIVRWVLVLITALVATGSILSFAGVHFGSGTSASSGQVYYCPMHPSVVQDHPGECPICSMTLVLKSEGKASPSGTMKPATAVAAGMGSETVGGKYYCPMHPTRTSDAPNARCPDCGMKMVPQPAASAAGKAVMAAPTMGVPGLADVDLTPERIQLIGMRTATVKREAIGGDLRTVGVVAANERGLAQINTRFGGWIQKLLVSETGERVRRGQVLATIYSPEVFRAEQELLLAHGWSSAAGDAKPSHDHEDFAGGLDANARGRLELLGIAPQEIDEMLRTGKATEAIPIRSPVDGYVVGKNAVAGVAVQSGSVLFEVADLTQVWVTADIYEQDISRIRVGQRARLELASYPGEMQTGKVTFIYPILDSGSRTLRLRLEFKNKSDRNGPRLRPGMYGTVYLDLPSTAGLTVPAEAVVDTGETHYLFVSKEGGRFEPRMVKVGAHLKDKVEILSGVAEGETVVTTGNFLIDSESRLRSAIEGQTSSEGAGAQSSACSTDFDAQKFPDKVRACRACEIQHRGMGTMEDDCKNAIPKPWR